MQTSNVSLLCDVRGSNKDERETVDSVNPAEGWTISEGASGRGDSSSWKTRDKQYSKWTRNILVVFSGMINMQHVGVLTPCSSCNLAHSSAVGTRFHTSGIKMTTVSILSPESNLSSAILCLEKGDMANKTSTVIMYKSNEHHLNWWEAEHVQTRYIIENRPQWNTGVYVLYLLTIVYKLQGPEPSALSHSALQCVWWCCCLWLDWSRPLWTTNLRGAAALLLYLVTETNTEWQTRKQRDFYNYDLEQNIWQHYSIYWSIQRDLAQNKALTQGERIS